jgi:anti-sigma regulatory factor (Ser/Thr protein kinase)
MDDMPAVVSMVEAFGAKHAIPPAAIDDINIALDELLNNIISYSSSDGDEQIMVRLGYQPGELSAEIHDRGKAFDPLQAGPPDLSGTVQTRKVGGLGIHFVRELMDDVVYSRVDNENRLLLKKKIPK